MSGNAEAKNKQLCSAQCLFIGSPLGLEFRDTHWIVIVESLAFKREFEIRPLLSKSDIKSVLQVLPLHAHNLNS